MNAAVPDTAGQAAADWDRAFLIGWTYRTGRLAVTEEIDVHTDGMTCRVVDYLTGKVLYAASGPGWSAVVAAAAVVDGQPGWWRLAHLER